jgi:hypothetical protein
MLVAKGRKTQVSILQMFIRKKLLVSDWGATAYLAQAT